MTLAGFEVTPDELTGAAATLGAVQGEVGCPRMGPGDLGSPELEAAMASFYASVNDVAMALGDAVSQASTSLGVGASAYETTDAAAMGGGR
jgi:hypothetical protein